MTAQEVARLAHTYLVDMMAQAENKFISLGFESRDPDQVDTHGISLYKANLIHPRRKKAKRLRLLLTVVESQEQGGSPWDRMLPELRPDERVQLWVGVFDLDHPKGNPISYTTGYFLPTDLVVVHRNTQLFHDGWEAFLERVVKHFKLD